MSVLDRSQPPGQVPAAPSPLRPAKSPTGSGPVAVAGPVLAVLVGALGVVLLQDALVTVQGSGSSWLTSATSSLVGVRPAGWMVPAGIVVALVGLWLLVTALRRRTRDALALTSASGAYVTTGDVARRASAAARDVDGVLSARSTATRHRVRVTVTTTGHPSTGDEVRAGVTEALTVLVRPLRVTVRAQSTDPDAQGNSS